MCTDYDILTKLSIAVVAAMPAKPSRDPSQSHKEKWFTYIPDNVGVSSMSQEKVHNGGVAILTCHTEWGNSIL